jgi:hypothetical protein
MELDTLKSNWKSAGKGIKGHNELWKMTRIKNHPDIQRIRIKLMVEAVFITFFLAVYYDGFDGAFKPLWANILLFGSAVAYIIARVFGFLVVRNPVKGENLMKSLAGLRSTLKLAVNAILVTSFLFGSAIILFFSSSIDFTTGKYFVLGGMLLALVGLVYLSNRNWFKRIERIDKTLLEFNDIADR